MASKNIKYMACLVVLATCLTSCVTTSKTAKTAQFQASTYTATVADLDVSDNRVSATLNPVPDNVRRGGMNNIKNTVEAMALEQNGNADVLVNPEFTYTVERGFFSKKVTSMTVTGRPAKYKNFHSLNDSVWSNPAFRGVGVRASAPLHKLKGAGRKPVLFKGGNEDAFTAEGGNFRKGFTWGMDFAAFYDFDEERTVPSGQVNFGYNVIPNLYVGVGSGVEWNTDYDLGFVPIYANVRYYFSKKRSAPFVDLRIGGSTEINDRYVDGGTYTSFALGYSFNAFDISIDYTYQRCKKEVRDYYDEWSHSVNDEFNRLGIRLGFRL